MGAKRSREPGSSRAGPSMPLPPPRVIVTSGTEVPSNSSLTTATFTAATGKWTSTSGSPTPRCPTRTPLSSGPRLGILSLITGTFTRERRWNSPPTIKHKQCQINGKQFPASQVAVQKPKPAIVKVAQAVVPEAPAEATSAPEGGDQ